MRWRPAVVCEVAKFSVVAPGAVSVQSSVSWPTPKADGSVVVVTTVVDVAVLPPEPPSVNVATMAATSATSAEPTTARRRRICARRLDAAR
jgi:hypothetical protein